ncbi:MAG: VWA domain-containing protein [Spirochaetales bacterium]|nr:VWA domain-containing protein [Spirochaetales bacterium]
MKRSVICISIFSIVCIFLLFSCESAANRLDEATRDDSTTKDIDKKDDGAAEIPTADDEYITKEMDLLDESEADFGFEDAKKRGDDSVPSSSGLRAGFADDNKQFNYFINFLTTYNNVSHYTIKIWERVVFKIKDKAGNSIPNAGITVYGNNTTLCKGKSYADGTFLFFPAEYKDLEYIDVDISYLQQTKSIRVMRNGKRQIDVVFDTIRPKMTKIPLDILFILDTTGSMGEEINRLKTTIEIINMNIASLSSKPQVRFGMVLYKDRGDEEYITKIIPLTGKLEEFESELNKVEADGGGDIREDLQAALDDTMKRIEWNTTGIRLGFVITDAPPHLDYGQEYTYKDAVHDARTKGIKIFTVGTGGLAVDGEYILRQISQYTYAKYIFLTYGEKSESEGGVTGSVSHHTGANFQTDKLEAIIMRFAKEELSYLTDQPLEEGEEFFEAVKIEEEGKEETLNKLFTMAISQLIDYSSIGIKNNTLASVIPILSTEKKYNVDAEYFTDQLLTSISEEKTFTIVAREELQKILEELELQLSGIVSDESAVKIGALLGAEVLITGKLYRKDTHYEIFFKLLRVETGEVLSVTKARLEKELGLSK